MFIGHRFHSSLFMAHRTDDVVTLTADMSELSRSGNPMSQMYDDACDTGFAIVSAKTGVTATFYLSESHRNRDGDITHWVFLPTADSLRRNVRLRETTVTIYNT